MRIVIVWMLVLLSLPWLTAQKYEVKERVKAFRTARLDAMRKLGESILGVHISSDSTVKDFVMKTTKLELDSIWSSEVQRKSENR